MARRRFSMHKVKADGSITILMPKRQNAAREKPPLFSKGLFSIYWQKLNILIGLISTFQGVSHLFIKSLRFM